MLLIDFLTLVYFATLLSMGIFTNIQTLYGNSNNISKFTSSTDISDLNSVTEPYTTAIIVNLFLICTLSIFGNILTLIAIPYVRLNYRSEFSILQINSVILILHLAFCDLLYAIVGFPHLILVGSSIAIVLISFVLGLLD